MDTIGSHILLSRSRRRSGVPAGGFACSCHVFGEAGADTAHYSKVRIVGFGGHTRSVTYHFTNVPSSTEVVNVLTVVANESFSAFANGLQREYVEAGDAPPPLPTDAKRRRQAKRNDRIYLDDPHFQRFWSQLNRLVRYRIRVVTPELVDACVKRLNDSPFPVRTLAVEKGRINLGAYKVHVDRVESGKAQLTLTLFDDEGEPVVHQRRFKPGDDIARELHEDRLRPLGALDIEQAGGSYDVVFTSLARRVSEGEEWEFTPTGFGATAQKQIVQVEARRYPVFNLIDRASRDTGITRPTVNAIFKGMRNDKKRLIFENPEGFATVFIGELRNALADHITERIEFVVDAGVGRFDRDELFPQVCEHPQRELIEAGEHGLYDLVQKDSEVEQHYVDAIRHEGDSIVFYFKFPPKFKIDLPRLIGDYNPDWGIARIHRNGDMEVRTFVHETKGTTQIGKLRFPHEKRKVRCAEKYFATIGVNYQTIDPSHVGAWWATSAERGVQTEM
ncbi:hypothetical protein JXA88_01555 [Candidatus Fermentibacteria bacterium]|nr:hypothetical protein [Candidatus Fermentibacteria bacterium]